MGKIQCYFSRDNSTWAIFMVSRKIGDKRCTQHPVKMLKKCQTNTCFTDEKHEAGDEPPPPPPVCPSKTSSCRYTWGRFGRTHTTHHIAPQDITQHNMTHHGTRARDRQSLTCTCAIPTLSTVQADVHPIANSGSFVATCPNTFASEVHMVDLEQ